MQYIPRSAILKNISNCPESGKSEKITTNQMSFSMRNVKDFGAIGDGVTLDTAAIQAALDAGGIVHFPEGTYLTGSVYLRSNGGLDLAPGAVILASPDPAHYNADDFIPENRVFTAEKVSGSHLVIADNVDNVIIRGGGRIDGNRPAVLNQPNPKNPKRFLISGWRMGQMLFFVNSTNIIIEDIYLTESQYWNCFLHGCDYVKIRGVRIENDFGTMNGDGIDVDCCRFVTISDCIIHSADDCITLRGCADALGGNRPCEYVTVNNCILSTRCNAFRIGVGSGSVRRCTLSNIIIRDTRTAICLVSQYTPASSGVQIEDIMFSNIYMDCVRFFNIATTPRGLRPEEAKVIRRISFNNLRGSADTGSIIQGSRKGYVQDIIFTDLKVDYRPSVNVNPEVPEYGYGEFIKDGNPPAAFYLHNADDVKFKNSSINLPENDEGYLYSIMGINSSFNLSEDFTANRDVINKNC